MAALLKESGLVASMNEARRTIAEGGAYVNNERVTDAEAAVDPASLLHGRYLVLRRGRRTIAGVELRRLTLGGRCLGVSRCRIPRSIGDTASAPPI